MAADNLEGFQFDVETLSIYIQYTHLPVGQFAALLYAIDEVVDNLKQLFPSKELKKHAVLVPFIDAADLSLLSVQTGNSIEFNLKFIEGKPKLRFRGEEPEFELSLPHWTALLIVAGCILASGVITAEKLSEIEHLHLENENMLMELAEMELEKLTDNSNPMVNTLNIRLNQFNQQINQYNIQKVIINGVVVKNGKQEDKK